MIPLRDSIRSRTAPFVTVFIIAANVLVFVREAALGPAAEAFLYQWGFVPARFFDALHGGAPLAAGIVPLFSSIFLHGGVMHLAGNMWFLWIFGDNVEDRLGHAAFAFFYLACGVLAGLAHAFAAPSAALPAVGASGAIAGVLGAYFVFHPTGRVLTLIPLFVFFTTAEIPAAFFLIVWFAFQALSGAVEWSAGPGAAGETGGVAWWAHVGGFLAGAAIAFFVSRFSRPRAVGWSPR